jgi:hypothetical protein
MTFSYIPPMVRKLTGITKRNPPVVNDPEGRAETKTIRLYALTVATFQRTS